MKSPERTWPNLVRSGRGIQEGRYQTLVIQCIYAGYRVCVTLLTIASYSRRPLSALRDRKIQSGNTRRTVSLYDVVNTTDSLLCLAATIVYVGYTTFYLIIREHIFLMLIFLFSLENAVTFAPESSMKIAATSIKETAANVGGPAKSRMEKTKATLQKGSEAYPRGTLQEFWEKYSFVKCPTAERGLQTSCSGAQANPLVDKQLGKVRSSVQDDLGYGGPMRRIWQKAKRCSQGSSLSKHKSEFYSSAQRLLLSSEPDSKASKAIVENGRSACEIQAMHFSYWSTQRRPK
ncbi:nuclear pore complex protein NUP1-like protein [Tanacetum coccineum]